MSRISGFGLLVCGVRVRADPIDPFIWVHERRILRQSVCPRALVFLILLLIRVGGLGRWGWEGFGVCKVKDVGCRVEGGGFLCNVMYSC
jgi:hypothetical protein